MQFGCLLPFLIIFNLFFGWIFLRPLTWALLELGLVLIFILTWKIIIRRIAGAPKRRGRPGRRNNSGGVIDVQGQEIKPHE